MAVPQAFRTLALMLTLMYIAVQPVTGQPRSEEIPAEEIARFDEIEVEMRKIGNWDAEFDRMMIAMDNVFRSNNWNSESDKFALDMVAEVGRIPPWDVTGRLNRSMEIVRERYKLSDESAAKLQGLVIGESVGMALKNSGMMLKQVRQWVDCRANGKPITPELAAEWSSESRPMYDEAWKAVERIVKQIEPGLSPEGRAVLERDLGAAKRRHDSLMEQMKEWARGNWKASDWGMQDDPIQLGLIDPSRFDPIMQEAEAARRIPTHWIPSDPTTWIAYVIYVEQKAQLDPGQITTVRSIHDELTLRAADYARANRAALAAVSDKNTAVDDAYGPIRELFERLRGRIDGVLTAEQRAGLDR